MQLMIPSAADASSNSRTAAKNATFLWDTTFWKGSMSMSIWHKTIRTWHQINWKYGTLLKHEPYLSKIIYSRWECIPQNPLVRPSLEIEGHIKHMNWDSAPRWWFQILFWSLALWFWRKNVIFVLQWWNTQTWRLRWFIILTSFLIRNHLQQHPVVSFMENTNVRFVEWSTS